MKIMNNRNVYVHLYVGTYPTSDKNVQFFVDLRSVHIIDISYVLTYIDRNKLFNVLTLRAMDDAAQCE